MLSFGWSEILLILIVVVIIVGPKEIPNLLKQIGSFSKSIKKISREFKSTINDVVKESELDKVNESLSEIKEIKENINPINSIDKEIDSVKKTTNIFEKEITNLNNKENKDSKK